jgi:hypothetical protein
MDKTFDEAYATYLNSLAKLDSIDDISEKNLLFRKLTEQLSELEDKLKTRMAPEQEANSSDDFWI